MTRHIHPTAAVVHAHIVLARAIEGSLPIPSVPATPIPGTNTLTGLANGLVIVGLIACFLGLVISVISMAIGGHTQNARLAERGRSGLIASLLGAAVLGAAMAILQFAFATGGHIS
ncbi:MAG: DUF6112 family protein [Actinomycetota bacterium]|nr:DUF6112 family protein [Actinomycetota bacterium]